MKLKNKPIFAPSIASTVIYTNDQIGLIHDACKICWDKAPEGTTEEKLKYIGKRISSGHESIIEHSNIIMGFVIDHNYANKDIFEILSLCNYLYTKIEYSKNESYMYLLIGGSIRGYKYIFNNIKNTSNYILNKIRESLYECSYKEFFSDFIESGLMEEHSFRQVFEYDEARYPAVPTSDKVELVNIDPIEEIYEKVRLTFDNKFTYDDLLDLCSVTVLFKNMSRTATHQLVRHRNAITQESQRYVDYSGAKFISPDEYEDKYSGKLYKIKLFGVETELYMHSIGSTLMDIYRQLRSQDVLKQDARGFLPSNTACGKLYMTFTYKNIIKFLELRTERAAQSEIRCYANIIEKEFCSVVEKYIGNIYKYLTPKYMLTESDYSYDGIDEILEVLEEEVEKE